MSLVNRYVFLDHLSWDAYNEGTHLPKVRSCGKDQVERYKNRFGFYPETVIGDKIYGTHENRKYLKSLTIHFSGKALGRPSILTRSEAKLERRKRKEEQGIRNRVEGKFGEGKRRYSLNRQGDGSDCVKAKTKRTSESWITTVFFVMNLASWLRKDLFLLFFKLLEIVKERLMNRSQLAFCTANGIYIYRNLNFSGFEPPSRSIAFLKVFCMGSYCFAGRSFAFGL